MNNNILMHRFKEDQLLKVKNKTYVYSHELPSSVNQLPSSVTHNINDSNYYIKSQMYKSYHI